MLGGKVVNTKVTECGSDVGSCTGHPVLTPPHLSMCMFMRIESKNNLWLVIKKVFGSLPTPEQVSGRIGLGYKAIH